MAFFSDLRDRYSNNKKGKNSDSGKRGSKSSFGRQKDSYKSNEYRKKSTKFSSDAKSNNKKRTFDKSRGFEKIKQFNESKREISYLDYEYEKPNNTAFIENTSNDENILVGRNPIREAIKTGRDIEKLLVLKGDLNGSAREIVAKARESRIVVQEVDKRRLDAISKHHQGLIAITSAYQYHDIDEILALAESRGEAPFVVILDGITDPHNLGAIIRSAECAGAHGVIVPARRSAGLSASAVKASAGAVEHIMVAKVNNLASTLEMLKSKGLWIYAADMNGEDFHSVNYDGGVALVVGSEGEGISKLILEKSDKILSIGLKGKIESLNASVAAGILLFEIAKTR